MQVEAGSYQSARHTFRGMVQKNHNFSGNRYYNFFKFWYFIGKGLDIIHMKFEVLNDIGLSCVNSTRYISNRLSVTYKGTFATFDLLLDCAERVWPDNIHVEPFCNNEEPAWKLTQKVALTHNSVKNNVCDVIYVLKEPRRRSKCVFYKAWRFQYSVDVAFITELCFSAAYRISSSGSSLHWDLCNYKDKLDLLNPFFNTVTQGGVYREYRLVWPDFWQGVAASKI
jgi:hypothetical protein